MNLTMKDIPRLRLLNQQLLRPSFTAPGDVVRWMGAMQAQDYPASLRAIGVRLQDTALTKSKKHITAVMAVIVSIAMIGASLTACAQNAGEDQALAYLTIAQELIPFEYIEDDETDVPRTFLIDLSETKIQDKDAVYDLIAAHVKVVGAEVLRTDDLSLDVITNLDTEDEAPTLLAFCDEKLTRTKLVTELAVSWPRQHGGYGTKYTIQKKSDSWEITASEPAWIS